MSEKITDTLILRYYKRIFVNYSSKTTNYSSKTKYPMVGNDKLTKL